MMYRTLRPGGWLLLGQADAVHAEAQRQHEPLALIKRVEQRREHAVVDGAATPAIPAPDRAAPPRHDALVR